MRLLAIAAALMLAATKSAQAQGTAPNAALAPIGFLVGNWDAGVGKVADTGQRSSGASVITTEAGGAVMLRRDHTDLFGADGKPAGGFDQIMMIYPEDGTLHADYADGAHIIHYDRATIVPNASVTFTSVAIPGAPHYRLTYAQRPHDALAVTFEIETPGQTTYHEIASGILHRHV